MRRRRWKWGWDIKGGICLFTQTLTLRTLSHCVRRPTTLSPPHYEKAKPHREATCRCSGQQCQPSSHPRPGSRCQGHRHTVHTVPSPNSWPTKSKMLGLFCNQAGSMGPSWDRPLPVCSAAAPLWNTQIIVFGMNFLSCAADVKTAPTKRRTTWWPWAHSPGLQEPKDW